MTTAQHSTFLKTERELCCNMRKGHGLRSIDARGKGVGMYVCYLNTYGRTRTWKTWAPRALGW